jgi:hypothetical protein
VAILGGAGRAVRGLGGEADDRVRVFGDGLGEDAVQRRGVLHGVGAGCAGTRAARGRCTECTCGASITGR